MVSWERIAAIAVATVLILIGLFVLAIRLAGVDDRMDVAFGWLSWGAKTLETGLGRLEGPREAMPGAVYAIEGHPLADGPGGLPKELLRPGAELDYLVRHNGMREMRRVRLEVASAGQLAAAVWGLVIGCVVLGCGVWWLRLRRPPA